MPCSTVLHLRRRAAKPTRPASRTLQAVLNQPCCTLKADGVHPDLVIYPWTDDALPPLLQVVSSGTRILSCMPVGDVCDETTRLYCDQKIQSFFYLPKICRRTNLVLVHCCIPVLDCEICCTIYYRMSMAQKPSVGSDDGFYPTGLGLQTRLSFVKRCWRMARHQIEHLIIGLMESKSQSAYHKT